MILVATLLIGGCSTTQPPSIAPPPSSLMQAPPENLETFAAGSHPLEVVADNYKTYHIVKDRLKNLQRWVHQQVLEPYGLDPL